VVTFTLMLLYLREKSPSICSVGGWLGTTGGLDAVRKENPLLPAGIQTTNPHSCRLKPSHILPMLCQLQSVSASAWLGKFIHVISPVIPVGF